MNKLLSGCLILSITALVVMIPDLNQRSHVSAKPTFPTVPQEPKLELAQVRELILNKPSERALPAEKHDKSVAAEIQGRGIAFRLTEEELASLKRLGAGSETIQALRAYVVNSRKNKARPKNPKPPGLKIDSTTNPKRIKILVANFAGDDPLKYGVTSTIIRDLNREIRVYRGEMSLEPLKETITEQSEGGGRKFALGLGTKRKGNIVLWGYLTTAANVELYGFVEVVRAPAAFHLLQNSDTETSPILDLDELRVQKKFSKKMTDLVFWAISQARLEARDFSGAIQGFTRALARAKGQPQITDLGVIYFHRGLAYYGENRIKLAIGDYDELIKLRPAPEKDPISKDVAAAYYNRGFFYLEDRQYELAVTDLTQAARFKSDIAEFKSQIADVYITRGFAYSKIGKYDLAIADNTEALKLNAERAQVYYNRGEAFRNKDQYYLAITDFSKALQLDSDFARARTNRENTYAEAYSQYDRAIAYYDEVVRTKPVAEAFLERGNAYSRKRDYERAIADYGEAIKLKPNYALAYNNRAIAYHMKGEQSRAVADRNEAVKIQRYY